MCAGFELVDRGKRLGCVARGYVDCACVAEWMKEIRLCVMISRASMRRMSVVWGNVRCSN